MSRRAFWYTAWALAALVVAVAPAIYIKSQCNAEKPHHPASYHITIQSEGSAAAGKDAKRPSVPDKTPPQSVGGQVTEKASAESTYYPPEEPFDWWRRFLCDVNIADYILAYFTIVLAASTIGLSWVTWHALELGRAEFAASHRPLLRIRYCRLLESDDQGRPRAAFSVSNVGDSAAVMTDCVAQLTLWSNGLPDPNFSEGEQVGQPRRFISGASEEYSVSSRFQWGEVGETVYGEDWDGVVRPHERIMALSGFVTYTTVDSAITRTTAFYRRYAHRSGRFVRIKDAEDWDYED